MSSATPSDRVTQIESSSGPEVSFWEVKLLFANGLAEASGIDSHAVSRWIKHGHLKAQLRGTARGQQQNGDIYLIREKDVRRFILEHPTEIDLRKVDQLWFLDVITDGLVCPA